MRARIFISQPIPGLALEMLRAAGEVDMGQDPHRIMPKAEYVEHVRRCDCLFHLEPDTVDRAVLEANPKLRVIASQAVTPALVDVAEATRVLLNLAGGPAVDEQALVDALKARAIAGATLGVFDAWPRVRPDILQMERVVVSPYVGAAVKETQARIAVMVADNILAVIRGERPPNLYNPEIWG